MKDGTASRTARSVAAHRLDYARIDAPYGDPAADDALTRDVAAGLPPKRNRLHEYIRARTAFFDRAVTSALDRGVAQVVIGAAGYDGRGLRFAKPGVRWFEVDHPATQADKLERLARLGLDARHIRFIPADFAVDPIAGPLRAAGLDPDRETLVLLEGVAVYLEMPVLRHALDGFRQAVPAGSTLAISVSVHRPDDGARRQFQERVAAFGEPARTVLTFEQAHDVLAEAGWAMGETGGRPRSAGLLLARAGTPSAPPERMRPAPTRPASPPAPDQRAARAGERLPLSALLSQALVAFTIEADNEAEHRMPHSTTSYGSGSGSGPWLTSLLMWANCLRHLPDEGITVAELRARARTGTNLDGMRRWGYVTFTPDPGRGGHPPGGRPPVPPDGLSDGRARVYRTGKRPQPDALIRPTARGSAARDTWQQATADVEWRWRERLGPGAFDTLRAALAGVVEKLDPALADCLPILGYGLFTRPDPARRALPGRVAAAQDPAAQEPAAQEPAALQEPAAAGSGGDLPLWALLSRPLLAFARQYEREPGPSLALSANVLRVLTADGEPTKDIPARAGVSKESVAMAITAARERGLVDEGPDPAGGRFRMARLTAGGVAARDAYPAEAAGIEADWRTRFGGETVTGLRQALEPLAAGDRPLLFAGLDPYPDNWRARTGPIRTLPHYPMTLHRGGYPDGS
jgi:methyltransferase (TIGR00027 family)